MKTTGQIINNTIGIIGVSSEGAAYCYTAICEESWARFSKFVQPEIILHNYSLSYYIKLLESSDKNGMSNLILSSINKLKTGGADVVICPDNSVHFAIDEVLKKTSVPLISILDIVIDECKLNNYERIGLLGTKYTMKGDFYFNALSKEGIEIITPDNKMQDLIHSIILNKLGPGQIVKRGYKTINNILGNLYSKGSNAIVLGCTELPLIISEGMSPLPLINTTRLLAKKSVEFIVDFT